MNFDPFYPFEEQNIPNHPADTLTVRQFLEQDGRTLEQIAHAVMFGDENAPALCDHGCEVEPDGTCAHGCQSLLLAIGLI